MKTNQNYIFWDDVIREYASCLGKGWEKVLIKDLKAYFSCLTKDSEIFIITMQDVEKVNDWFCVNNLRFYINKITNPNMK